MKLKQSSSYPDKVRCVAGDEWCLLNTDQPLSSI